MQTTPPSLPIFLVAEQVTTSLIPQNNRRQPHSYEMAGQKKVGNALADSVLVVAVAADEFPLHQLRLEQQGVQLLEHLLVGLEVFCRWRLVGEGWEAELGGVSCLAVGWGCDKGVLGVMLRGE